MKPLHEAGSARLFSWSKRAKSAFIKQCQPTARKINFAVCPACLSIAPQTQLQRIGESYPKHKHPNLNTQR